MMMKMMMQPATIHQASKNSNDIIVLLLDDNLA
jgi:hypothetical protein